LDPSLGIPTTWSARPGGEGNRGHAVDHGPQQCRRQTPFEAERCDVGVEDDLVGHESGELSSTGRVCESQELIQFFVGFEQAIAGKIVRRLDGLGVHSLENLVQLCLSFGKRAEVELVMVTGGMASAGDNTPADAD
jgi:hypothetical protein